MGSECTPTRGQNGKYWSGLFDFDPCNDILQRLEDEQPSLAKLLQMPLARKMDGHRPAPDGRMVYACPKTGCFVYNARLRDLVRTHFSKVHGDDSDLADLPKTPLSDINSKMIAFAKQLPNVDQNGWFTCAFCSTKTPPHKKRRVLDQQVCDPCRAYYLSHNERRPVDVVALEEAKQAIQRAVEVSSTSAVVSTRKRKQTDNSNTSEHGQVDKRSKTSK